jgi:hypothetical protein
MNVSPEKCKAYSKKSAAKKTADLILHYYLLIRNNRKLQNNLEQISVRHHIHAAILECCQ